MFRVSAKGLHETKPPNRFVSARHLANAQTVAAWLRDNPDVRPELFHKAWARWLIRETRARTRGNVSKHRDK